MQTEFIAVSPDWNVGRAIDYMRETEELPEQFYELYVVDDGGRFLGAVPLDRLLRSKRPVTVSELMEAERRRVPADEDQEERGAAVPALRSGRGAGRRRRRPAGRRYHLR